MAVNGIPFADTDIIGNYGVMHGIEGVLGVDGEYFPCPFVDDDDLFPSGGPTFDTLEELTIQFQRPLFTAVLAAGESSATIFGPDDSAFSAIDRPGTEEEILEVSAPSSALFRRCDSRNQNGLTCLFENQVLKGHVVAGMYTSDQIKAEGCLILDTLAGTKIRAMYVEEESAGRRLAGHTGGGTIMINDAKVIASNLETDGALIHGIDNVIFPDSFADCPAKPTMAPAATPTESSPVMTSAAFAARLSTVFCCIITLVAL